MRMVVKPHLAIRFWNVGENMPSSLNQPPPCTSMIAGTFSSLSAFALVTRICCLPPQASRYELRSVPVLPVRVHDLVVVLPFVAAAAAVLVAVLVQLRVWEVDVGVQVKDVLELFAVAESVVDAVVQVVDELVVTVPEQVSVVVVLELPVQL